MRVLLISFFCAVIISRIATPLVAQEIEFEFSVYRMEEVIAAALEERLIQGGETAIATVARLPDFEKQKRVTKEDSFVVKVPAGEKVVKASSENTVAMPSGESKDGLEVEIDPILVDGVVSWNMHAAYNRKDREEPIEKTFTGQVAGRSGEPVFICRWQWGDDLLLLIAEVRTGEDSPVSTKIETQAYVETAFYPSGPDAVAGRNRLVSARFVTRSGQRTKVAMTQWLRDDNIPDSDQPGMRTTVDPVLVPDGSMKLSAESTYSLKAGGRARGDDGEKVSRLEIRDMAGKFELQPNKPAAAEVTLTKTGDDSVKDRSIGVVKFSPFGK
jgi:hypothetical protein